ncbi:hypothetical protein E2C01_037715 [Portunus trituberculatus]|uniref:Uncharacterized protein n=1 Tax=Portunus trituberculatus TaxID=210409 RepID=A0A5B7FES2_PORTR|nr:hypothetical protein [Portunus trituberculatus]
MTLFGSLHRTIYSLWLFLASLDLRLSVPILLTNTDTFLRLESDEMHHFPLAEKCSVVCLHFSGTATFQGRTSKEQLAKMSSSVVYEWTKLSEEFLIGTIKGQK